MCPSPVAPSRPSRRLAASLAALATAVALGGSVRTLLAGDDSGGRGAAERRAEDDLNARRRAAIRRGGDWLVAQQGDDGLFGGARKVVVAQTALCVTALLASGSGMDRGPHGKAVARAVRKLVELGLAAPETGWPAGYIRSRDDTTSRMHGQGYAMLALASALGTANAEDEARIRRLLRATVRVAESSQTATGGWGYEPGPSHEHEGSVTVTIAQGLRAARDAGLHVNQEVVRRGLDYLKNSQKLSSRGTASTPLSDDGSFKYSMNTESSSYALTAAALSAFRLFGEYAREGDIGMRIDRGTAYLRRRLRSTVVTAERPFFHYGHFYAAWFAWQVDGDRPTPAAGERWDLDPASADIERTSQLWGPWHAKMYRLLLDDQLDDGRWQPKDDPYSLKDVIPTAFAVLTLAIPDEMIPVFQR